jgi:hypothetical protein
VVAQQLNDQTDPSGHWLLKHDLRDESVAVHFGVDDGEILDRLDAGVEWIRAAGGCRRRGANLANPVA